MVKRDWLARAGVGWVTAGWMTGCGLDPDDVAADMADDGTNGALDGDVVAGETGTDDSTGAADEDDVDGSSDGESGDGVDPQQLCGNGVVEVHESCDDANDVDGDGCNADCRISGSVVWTRTHDGDAHAEDHAVSIAILPNGDAIAGGTAMAVEGLESGWIRRYDGEGTVVWVDRPALGFAAHDDVAGVAVDRDGFVVACGSFANETGDDVWARRYATDGALVWHTEWSNADACSDIAAADDGRIVVTGGSTVGLGKDRVIWLAKLNSHGDHLWETRTGSSPVGDELGRALAIDEQGRVVVAGRIGGVTADDSNVFIGRWSAAGVGPEWSFVESSNTPGLDEARGLAIDGSTIVVVGSLAASVETRGFHLQLDDTAAAHGLTLHDNRGVTSIDAVAIDGAGDLVIVGAVLDADGSRDIWIEKRDLEWAVRWTTTVAGTDDGDDFATDVAIGDDGLVLVAGSVSTSSGDSDAWVSAFAP